MHATTSKSERLTRQELAREALCQIEKLVALPRNKMEKRFHSVCHCAKATVFVETFDLERSLDFFSDIYIDPAMNKIAAHISADAKDFTLPVRLTFWMPPIPHDCYDAYGAGSHVSDICLLYTGKRERPADRWELEWSVYYTFSVQPCE
jgi:hypothetical protein